jgi:RNA polymerase sigma-70 factor (ECF subfamily)
VERAAEQAEFRRLFDEAYRPLLAYALRRGETQADAEEVVAETLLVAWRRRADLPAGAEALPWLYGVARRVLANQRRGRGRRRRLERVLEPLARAAAGPEQATEMAEAARALVTASRRLSDGDQEVLRLAVWEGLSHREIAVALGCSENAAALRLHRARERLRAELLKDGGLSGHDVAEVIR